MGIRRPDKMNTLSTEKYSTVYDLYVGMPFEYKGDTAKIMAIADNWIMARKKGCIPFTIYYMDIIELISIEKSLIKYPEE